MSAFGELFLLGLRFNLHMKMNIKSTIVAYITVLIAFGILDGVWLGVIAMPLYQQAFDGLLREPFITWPWVAFYLLYCLAVVYLAIRPYHGEKLIQATLAGLVLGAAAYGTYNLTGYSIIEGWPLNMTIIDWLWGSIGTSIIATCGAWAASKAS